MYLYFSDQFIIYLFRWIISGIVMLLPLYFLIKYNCCDITIKINKLNKSFNIKEYLHILILQIIGAFIFYPIDKLIFK